MSNQSQFYPFARGTNASGNALLERKEGSDEMSVGWPTRSPLSLYASQMELGVVGNVSVHSEGVGSRHRGCRASTQPQCREWAGRATVPNGTAVGGFHGIASSNNPESFIGSGYRWCSLNSFTGPQFCFWTLFKVLLIGHVKTWMPENQRRGASASTRAMPGAMPQGGQYGHPVL